jgi:multisubunit Na+/H+ antiporter MnhB subunit
MSDQASLKSRALTYGAAAITVLTLIYTVTDIVGNPTSGNRVLELAGYAVAIIAGGAVTVAAILFLFRDELKHEEPFEEITMNTRLKFLTAMFIGMLTSAGVYWAFLEVA